MNEIVDSAPSSPSEERLIAEIPAINNDNVTDPPALNPITYTINEEDRPQTIYDERSEADLSLGLIPWRGLVYRFPLGQPLRSWLSCGLFFTTWGLWFWYLVLRCFTRTRSACPGASGWTKGLLLLAECVLLFPEGHFAFGLILSLVKGKDKLARPRLRLAGNRAPMVHVFIT
jgi:hypothetical protein